MDSRHLLPYGGQVGDTINPKNRFIESDNNTFRWVRKIQSPAEGHLKNPGSEPLSYNTLGDVIAQTVDKYPDRVAVKSVHEGVTITYEQLLKQVTKTLHYINFP